MDAINLADAKARLSELVERAAAGDTVLCAGKGHEKTLETATSELPWDERAVVTAAIGRRFS